MITKEQYDEATVQKAQAEGIISAFFKQKAESFDDRLKSGKPFTDYELIYAAVARCPCGHGLAYPKDCGGFHYWDCSAILKGIAKDETTHTDRLPFAFYEIKSDQQPSAMGASTRIPLGAEG